MRHSTAGKLSERQRQYLLHDLLENKQNRYDNLVNHNALLGKELFHLRHGL